MITYTEWCKLHKQRMDERRKMFALLRYYLHIEPYDLPNETIARHWVEVDWIRTTQAKVKNE